MMEEKRKESDVDVDDKFAFGLIGFGVGVAGLYLAYSGKNTESPQEDVTESATSRKGVMKHDLQKTSK